MALEWEGLERRIPFYSPIAELMSGTQGYRR
jgi:hypothetical protein